MPKTKTIAKSPSKPNAIQSKGLAMGREWAEQSATLSELAVVAEAFRGVEDSWDTMCQIIQIGAARHFGHRLAGLIDAEGFQVCFLAGAISTLDDFCTGFMARRPDASTQGIRLHSPVQPKKKRRA